MKRYGVGEGDARIRSGESLRKKQDDGHGKMVGRQNRRNAINLPLEVIEEKLQVFFGERPEVTLVYLFGSYLKRTAGPFHDIDVAVFVTPDRLRKLDRALPYGYGAELNSKLANNLRYGPVDVVLLNQAPPLLLRQIIGTGKLVLCRSEAERIRFEVGSLKRHADTAHIRKIKRFYTNRRIQRGLAAYV